ncbi:MAG: sugar phosphate isomerase/epimerase family protein [Verrucomicrobiota bacterium]
MKKYSVILGNLGNTCDRFCHSYKESPGTMQMLEQAVAIPHVEGIELVGTWDVSVETAGEMKKALADNGKTCVSIIPDLFSDPIWKFGSLSSRDSEIRRKAVEHMRVTCGVAETMGCDLLNIWPGQDGYDYLFQGDYLDERNGLVESIAKVAEEFSHLRFALEYKPKEPRTHSYLARMADTLLVCLQTGMDNVGVTIDTGHAFMAGENVAESIVLAKQAGDRLFHMHFNDNHKEWDDDMIAGSIHSLEYIEMLYWLDKCGYDGWFSMDQYPYREDAAGAISESITWLRAFDRIASENREGIAQTIAEGDAVKTSAFLRSILLGA